MRSLLVLAAVVVFFFIVASGCKEALEPVCPPKDPYCYERRYWETEANPCLWRDCGPAGKNKDAGPDAAHDAVADAESGLSSIQDAPLHD